MISVEKHLGAANSGTMHLRSTWIWTVAIFVLRRELQRARFLASRLP
jgi:hypothetical protein